MKTHTKNKLVKKTPSAKVSPASIDVTRSLPALKQAAKNALQLARDTGTPLVIWKDGKIVDLNPPRKKRPARRAK